MSRIGFMTPDADGQLVPVQFAVPEQVLRGTTDEKGHIYVTSENGNTMIGVWECGAYAEYLRDYPYDEMCTVVEGILEITEEGGTLVTYKAGDQFYMAKGFTGLWESKTRFKKYFMISA